MGREEEGQGEGERFKWGHEEGQVGEVEGCEEKR